MASQTTPSDPAYVAPPPWGLGGTIWIMPYWAPGGKLPHDAYPAHERGTPYSDEATNGKFLGKMGYVQVVRYTETAVGPYDEIIFIPGFFDDPITKKAHPRVTTIYVSTEASIRNGRKNWSIPKYLADFKFTPVQGNPSATHVEISLPSNPNKPFFKATFTPQRFVPSFPLSQHIPLGSIIQPPIPAPADPNSMLVGCPEWIETTPQLGGWLRLVWPEPQLDGEGRTKRYGDGESFPDVQPATWALQLTPMKGLFPVGKVVSGENSKTK